MQRTFEQTQEILLSENYTDDILRNICKNPSGDINWKISAAYELRRRDSKYVSDPDVKQFLPLKKRKT